MRGDLPVGRFQLQGRHGPGARHRERDADRNRPRERQLVENPQHMRQVIRILDLDQGAIRTQLAQRAHERGMKVEMIACFATVGNDWRTLCPNLPDEWSTLVALWEGWLDRLPGIDIVGIFPDYASAQAAWRAKATRRVRASKAGSGLAGASGVMVWADIEVITPFLSAAHRTTTGCFGPSSGEHRARQRAAPVIARWA